MKRAFTILLMLALALVLAVGIARPIGKITNRAEVVYTDGEGREVVVPSNEATVTRLDPPRLAGVPAKVLPGEVSTLTVFCDIGGEEWSYLTRLPLFGGAYLPGSLVIDRTTGEVVNDAGADDVVVVELSPRAEPGEVKLSYQVKW
jgi:ABC-type Fe3+-hydroxamate transport system substrate-binding protein